MTGSDEFLSRWSRRKQDAAKQTTLPAKDEPVEQGGQKTKSLGITPPGTKAPETNHAEPAFDLSKLPSLDSIGPQTDIRMFMQPGVPAALSRAALRRAWAADPAIRDFIGLSENSWDFTAPDSMSGFGPLLPTDDVKKLLAQVFREEKPELQEQETPKIAQTNLEQSDATPDKSQQLDEPGQSIARDDDHVTIHTVTSQREEDLLQRTNNTAATQKEADEKVSTTTQFRRRHGGALPS